MVLLNTYLILCNAKCNANGFKYKKSPLNKGKKTRGGLRVSSGHLWRSQKQRPRRKPRNWTVDSKVSLDITIKKAPVKVPILLQKKKRETGIEP